MASAAEERANLLKALRDLQPVSSAWSYKQQVKTLKKLQPLLAQVNERYKAGLAGLAGLSTHRKALTLGLDYSKQLARSWVFYCQGCKPASPQGLIRGKSLPASSSQAQASQLLPIINKASLRHTGHHTCGEAVMQLSCQVRDYRAKHISLLYILARPMVPQTALRQASAFADLLDSHMRPAQPDAHKVRATDENMKLQMSSQYTATCKSAVDW